MKILVLEYICGGGFVGQPLPSSLAREGELMLQALISDLANLPGIELLIPLDPRCQHLKLPANAEVRLVTADNTLLALLPTWLTRCDAVWPIAPETDGILTQIATLVYQYGKTLLLSSPDTIATCTDKLLCYQLLTAQQIPLVTTLMADDPITTSTSEWVLKPRDGCGCSDTQLVTATALHLAKPDPAHYIIQPYLPGQAASLSCIFKQGKAWLICYNQQQIEIKQGKFSLTACLVNAHSPFLSYYPVLLAQIAKALPSLWGYIGIDIIESPTLGPRVLEINPRLTSSYPGIYPATGINVAEQVLALLTGEPELTPSSNQLVEVKMGEN